VEVAENAHRDMVNVRVGKIELKLAVIPLISFMVLLYFKMIDRRIQRKEQGTADAFSDGFDDISSHSDS
jgi:hypothetical protein